MSKLGYAIIIFIVMLLFTATFAGTTVLYHDSRVRYKKHAEWKYEECTYCNGTGFVTEKKYDNKRNRTYVKVKLCPYCKGTGKHGMSRK